MSGREGGCIQRTTPGVDRQGGDFTRGDGTGGESIYGEKFDGKLTLSVTQR